ncbi:hypothetical protein HJC23_009191 [Cyclotella cryptica]|uniref:Uncharacterized protein n=1 Tax=Cyclotella cryptica TaxID=29204 RepID=A0ABD3PQA4_9STRA
MADASADKDISHSMSNMNEINGNTNVETTDPSFLPSPSASEPSARNNESQNITSAHTKSPTTSASESFYISNGRSLKALLILCEGLMDEEGNPIADMSDLPWSSARAKNIKLTAIDLRTEVERRWYFGWYSHNTTSKSLDNKSGNRVVKNIPSTMKKTLSSSRKQLQIERMAERAAVEEAEEQAQIAGKGANWMGKFPMLRLIHVLIDHDEIKRAFHNRHDLPSGRMALENRNTVEARTASVWQMMADKWNDPLFLPVTAALPNLHSDFSQPIPVLHELVSHMQLANADKVEERWQSMILQLNRMISKWERSGQGDGGYNFDGDDDNGCDDAYDSSSYRRSALDLRKNFVIGTNTYLLYLWEMLETHDLLGTSIQRLNPSVSSDNGNTDVPGVIIGVKHKIGDDEVSITSSRKSAKKSDMETLSDSITRHGESLVMAARIVASAASSSNEKNEEANTISRIERNIILRLPDVRGDREMYDTMMNEVKEIEKEINENLIKLKGTEGTPQKSNRSPN